MYALSTRKFPGRSVKTTDMYITIKHTFLLGRFLKGHYINIQNE